LANEVVTCLKSGVPIQLEKLVDAVRILSKGLTAAFAKIQTPYYQTTTGQEIVRQLGHRLPPDVIFDARQTGVVVEADRIILEWNGSVPSPKVPLQKMSGADLAHQVSDQSLPASWISITCFPRIGRNEQTRLLLESDNMYLWLRIRPNEVPINAYDH